MKQTISHERLLQVLDYCLDSGEFTWKVALSSKTVAGTRAGHVLNKTYWQVQIDKRFYQAHRLAWFYVNGKWPTALIDHINGCPSDNRYKNLREATHSENSQNRVRTTRNTSGYVGVSWHKSKQHWCAYITINHKKIHLGSFNSAIAASNAYAEGKKKFHAFKPLDVLSTTTEPA